MHLEKESRCPSSSATMTSGHPAHPHSRHVQLLMKFNEEIFKRNVLTDVECVVEGQVFKTHRAVLVCFSPYLKRKLLTPEGKPMKSRIEIPKIGPDEFEVLLQYMYTGNLEIDCNSFLDVYKAASFLEMEDAKIECLQIIDGRDEIRTYFYAYVLCKKLGVQQNWQRAFKLITHRFEESVFSNEFMKLNLDFVMEILSAQTIGARSETIVYLSALNWLNHDYDKRGVDAATVMKCVRFSSMAMDEIVACYHPPLLPQVIQIPEVMMMLFRATCYIAAKSEGQESWFKEYASPKRNLTLECLPMELWHKRIHPASPLTNCQRQEFNKPIEKSSNSDMWNIESTFSRLLRDPVEVIADNTGQENEHMGDRTNVRSTGYDYPVAEKDETDNDLYLTMKNHLDRDSLANVQPLYTDNGEDEKFRYRRRLDCFGDEFEPDTEYSMEGVKPFGKHSTTEQEKFRNAVMLNDYNVGKRKPSKLSRNSFSPNVIHVVLPETTKIIHLSKGPQKYSPAKPQFEQKGELSAEEQSNVEKGNSFKGVFHQGDREKTAAKVPVLDIESSSRSLSETYAEKEEIPCTPKTCPQQEEKNLERDNIATLPSTKAVERKIKDKVNYEKTSSVSKKVAPGKQDTKVQSCILVVCGMNPKNFKKDVGGEVFILDSKAHRWTLCNRTPEPRHNHCAAYLYNSMYVVGGCNPEETIEKNRYVAKRSCFKLDLQNLTWQIMREMRCSRYDHGLAVYDGKLFAIGGQDENGRLLKSVEVFDPKQNRWRCLTTNMCCGRKAMGAAAYDDRIWIVGGLIESGKKGQLQAISHVDCYHPEERKWYFNLYSLPEPLCFCCMAVWEGKLYCMGGMVRTNDDETRATDDVWFVYSGNQLWQKGPSLPQPRMGGVAVTYRDNLYFLGGFDPAGDLNNQNVFILTPNASSWITGPRLPSHLFGLSAVSFLPN